MIQEPLIYTTLWPSYAMDWTCFDGILLGSFIDYHQNQIQLIKLIKDQQNISNRTIETLKLKLINQTTHLLYPITKILWEPVLLKKREKKIFASTGDALRLWSIEEEPYEAIVQEAILEHHQYGTNSIAPITSFDWNSITKQIIVTASVDTTCVIWDIQVGEAKSQLIAHDREVFDVSFLANSSDVFVSTGAEGSIRMFDLRSLKHSTILYETGGELKAYNSEPLLRVSANTQEQNLLATFHLDSNIVHILDIRFPGSPVLDLAGHDGNINCVKWAPGCRNICATGGDDCQILIWNTTAKESIISSDILSYKAIKNYGTNQLNDSIFSWNADSEINNLCWSDDAEWIGTCWGRNFQGLKV